MTSVIIPAHNEAAVICRTLVSLLTSIGEREAEVIVACNACSDDTAKLARAVSSRVTVIETPRPGKCATINLAEQHARSFPRIYLDADITVSPTFFTDLERALIGGTAKAAWPAVRYDLRQASWPVAAFYRLWTALPYNRPGRIGVGAYALSEAGRASFGRFPEIISDDGFVRGLFGPDERAIVETCHTSVQPPRDLASLVAVRTRSRMGVYELRRKHPDVMRRHAARRELGWRDFAACLRLTTLAAAPIYAFVVLLTKYRARRRLRTTTATPRWDRDLTSRPVGQGTETI